MKPDQETELLLEGRNAVAEALRAGRPINKLFVADGAADHGLHRLAAQAKAAGAVVSTVDRRRLDQMSLTGAHQGVIAMAAPHEYASIDDMLSLARERAEPPLLVLCDELSDPRNLGAIVRSAECAGAHGVIIPKRRGVALTAAAAKAAAGALEYLPVARVTNLSAAIASLKERGLWIYGAAAEGKTPLYGADLRGPAAIVIGSEGSGLSRLVAERCDFLLSIPLRGRISSLNASTAAAVLLYEAVRQRYQAET